MIGHDQLIKDLLEAFFDDLLRLVVPDLARNLDLGSIRFLRDQLFVDLPQGDERRLDLVAEVDTRGGKPQLVLAHVEAEGEARRVMGPRMARYGMQLVLRHDKPVISIVVYRNGGPHGIEKVTVRSILWGIELWSYTYFAFGLKGSEAEEYLESPEPLAWALAAQMRPRRLSRPEHKLECLRRIVGAPVDKARRFLLANFVETYVQLEGREAEEYQALLSQDTNEEVAAMELTWADQIEARGIEKGIEQGVEKGIQKGIQKGIHRGMQELLVQQIEQKFGQIPDATRQRIRGITSKRKLTRLAGQVLTARSPDELDLG